MSNSHGLSSSFYILTSSKIMRNYEYAINKIWCIFPPVMMACGCQISLSYVCMSSQSPARNGQLAVMAVILRSVGLYNYASECVTIMTGWCACAAFWIILASQLSYLLLTFLNIAQSKLISKIFLINISVSNHGMFIIWCTSYSVRIYQPHVVYLRGVVC